MSSEGESTREEELAGSLGGLQLVRVRLASLVLRVRGDEDSLHASLPNARMETMTGVVEAAEGRALFNVGVRLRAPGESAPGDAPVLVQAERQLLYEGLPPNAPADALRELARTSALLAAWPYLRSDVHRVCLEADIPPLLLPLVKAPRLDGRSGASEPPMIGADWQAWREELRRLLGRAGEFVLHGHVSSLDRLAPGEVMPANLGELVDSYRCSHDSLSRRLGRAESVADVAAVVAESFDHLRRLGRLVQARADHYRTDHPEGLARWNEVASDAEKLHAAMREASVPGLDGPLRLPRC